MSGEHVMVWNELIALGDKVLEEPFYEQAILVCEEIVRRAQFNLNLLHQRLIRLGYGFADPHAALVAAKPHASAEIEAIEQELGAIPLIARSWYLKFNSVNFCQSRSQQILSAGIRPPVAPDIFGLGSHPVLIFQSLQACREHMRQLVAEEEEFRRQVPECEWVDQTDPIRSGHFLPLGGVASSCDPKGFPLPSRCVDAVIYDDGGGASYFVDELRTAFAWGGFPFWKTLLQDEDFYSPMEYRPNFKKLLPLLKAGMLNL